MGVRGGVGGVTAVHCGPCIHPHPRRVWYETLVVFSHTDYTIEQYLNGL